MELRKATAIQPKGSFSRSFSDGLRKEAPAFPSLKASRIPQIYSYDRLPVFCKIEVQLERSVRLPIKIRLGDVPYVDWLEGKRPTPGNY